MLFCYVFAQTKVRWKWHWLYAMFCKTKVTRYQSKSFVSSLINFCSLDWNKNIYYHVISGELMYKAMILESKTLLEI